MTTMTTVVDHYIAAWNERDEARRLELVQRAFASDGSYVDPARSGVGTEDIASMIAEAQGHFPDHHIELVAGPDAHHDRVRFTWQLFPEGAGPILTGYDYATVAEDGRLRDVTGFAEPMG